MLSKFKNKPVNDKMFIYILASTMLLSIILIIEIIVLKYPLQHTITWIFAIILSGVSLYFFYLNKYMTAIKGIFFVIMIFAILPYGWSLSDVRSPFPLAYAFVILIAQCNLLTGKLRISLNIGLVIVTITMLFLDIKMPELYPVIEDKNLIKDIFIQVPILFGVSYFLLVAYANDLQYKNAQLEKISTIDHLTGLYNRRYLYEYLEKLQQSSGNRKNIIVGMIDVNKFKDINDMYGHIIGDRVLIQIAKHIRKICTQSAIICRTGGDEFIIIMEYTESFSINTFIKDFQETSIECEDIPNITYSGGFIICGLKTPIDMMITNADKNMYKAKSELPLKLHNRIVFTNLIKDHIQSNEQPFVSFETV